jgi:hypothetical protein
MFHHFKENDVSLRLLKANVLFLGTDIERHLRNCLCYRGLVSREDDSERCVRKHVIPV